MYRRKPNETGDEIRLVENTEVDNGPLSASEERAEALQTRIKEETHVIPHRFVKVKRRIINKAISPKGKLVYWWTTVSCLGVLSFLFVLVPLVIEQTLDSQDCSDFVESDNELPYFYRRTGQLEICRQRKLVLEGTLGIGREYISETKINVFSLSMDSTLSITSVDKNCLRVQWLGLSSQEAPLCDCYKLGNSNWFGAYEKFVQNWPINISSHDSLDSVAFLPRDYLSDLLSTSDVFGPILHPLWLNTDGIGIFVDEGVQLHISMNTSHLCLIAQPFELDCTPGASENSTLAYTVCLFDTVAQTSRYFLNQTLHPQSTPSPTVFQKPIWSTWAELKTNLTSDSVGKFCNLIQENEFNASQLEIDDGYSRKYGELEFNANVNVSDPLFSSCRQFNITAWVHPFINYDSSNFKKGLDDGTFLPGISQIGGKSVSLVKWWHDYGGVINFINSSVAAAHAELLLQFQSSIGLSSFKFDAGEYTYLPKCVYVDGLNHPGDFTKAYVDFVGRQSYSERAEVRVGYFTQEQPVLVRLLDRTSTWGPDNGLQSVLNAVLSIGLGGYIFVMPDMIGGNGVTVSALDSTSLPSRELYVRWVQLSTFLPVMQFSIAPWRYDNETVAHIRSLTQLHYDLRFDILANNSLDSGYPMIRPLWWRAVDSNDERTWTISDQFFIGDDYMVAPMLTVNQREREVYFPLGSNYSVVVDFPDLSAKPVCPNNICIGGSTYMFNVSLFQILYFHVLN